jgi:membrane-bound lytic murein transglycosylase D
MPTVIEMPFNSAVKNCITMYAERRKQLVENMLGMSLYYMPIFEQALDRYGLPLELKYLPVIESALNPDAVSKVGATGLWQFMLPTATGEGLEVNSIVDQRRDPYASSDAAARYLKKLYDIYNDWSLAIASYNCGPGNVNKALRRAGNSTDSKKDFWDIYPYLPSETRGYVPAFIAANYIMNYYDKHNISPALARKPIVTDTIHVTRRVHFQQISDVMGIPMDELRVLNPQYRTDLIPGDIKPYSLVLPSLQVYAYLANEDSIVNHNAELYARRDVVEPSTGESAASDGNGEYVEELVVKYHTVARGETLNSIARKYGVTVASIRSANKVGSKVRRGQKLRINTYKRRYVAPTATPTDNAAAQAATTPTDSVATAPVAADTISATRAVSLPATAQAAKDTTTVEPTAQSRQVGSAMSASSTRKAEKQAQAKQSQSKKESKPKDTTHTVKKGENLSKIAAKYGTTVQAIRQANGISGDNIQAGQTLKIPAKQTSTRSRSKRRK